MHWFKNTICTPIMNRGFSLVELMITVFIVTLVTSVVLVRFSVFDGAVILRTVAFDTAIAIREAQVYAVSVVGNSGTFSGTFGVLFDESTGDEIIFFEDINENFQFDSGTDAVISVEEIRSGYTITDVTAVSSGTGNPNSITQASLVFQRPDLDAHFDTNLGAGFDAAISQLEIHISSADALTRTVVVYPSGQISVQ